MKNVPEIYAAERIKLYIQFLKKKKQTTQKALAKELKVASNAISHMLNTSEKTMRYSFSYTTQENGEKKFTRSDFIKKIETQYGLSVDENGQVIMEPTLAANSLNPQVSCDYFVYHHLEHNLKGQPSFKQSLLTLKKQGENCRAELNLQKAKNTWIKYKGEATFLPNSLKLTLFKENANKHTHGSVVFIQLDDAGLNNQILYGSFQASRLSFGLLVLERIEQELAMEHLDARQVPSLIAWDLLNQHLSQDGNRKPLPEMAQHPQSNLFANISRNFGVYEGVSLVPNFDELNHFIFEIRPDFTVRYSSLTINHLDGIARPYEHSLFYIQLRYNKELNFFLEEIIIKLKQIPGTDCMAGIMAGVNDSNAPLSGMAMIRKANVPYEQLVQSLQPVDLQGMKDKFPNLEQFLTGGDEFSNYIASDSAQTLFHFLRRSNRQTSLMPDLLRHHSLPLTFKPTQDQVERWAGTYRVYRLSTVGEEIIVNLARLNRDGTVELKGYRHGNFFTGHWFLVHNHLTLFLDRKNDNTPFLFVQAYQIENSSRKEHQWFHGLSLSQTTLSNLRAGLEVLHHYDVDFDQGTSFSIPLPFFGKYSEEYQALNRDFKGLANFITGRFHNLLHQTRSPQDPFEHEDDLKTTFFHSACMFAQKAQAAEEKSERQAYFYERFKKEMLLALEHGFTRSEGEMSTFTHERTHGHFKLIPRKYWDEVEHHVLGKKSGGGRASYTST